MGRLATIVRPTTVISVRGKDRDELMADPDFVYVGRPARGWRKTKWTNPFMASRYRDPVGLYGRHLRKGSLVHERYAARLGFYEIDFASLRSDIGELRGKTLGCWCGRWSPGQPDIGCHAVALAKLANATTEADPS